MWWVVYSLESQNEQQGPIWDSASQRGFTHWNLRIHLLIPWARRGYKCITTSWMTVPSEKIYPSKPSTLLLKVSMNEHLRKNKKCQTHVTLPPKSFSGLNSFQFWEFLAWVWFFSVWSHSHCISLPCICVAWLWTHANF